MDDATENGFIQIHTLHGYSGVLLNRDDADQAKRMTYGGAGRTRISSQCLKRHWRTADDPASIHRIADTAASVRSRDTVERLISPMMEVVSGYDKEIADRITAELLKTVYGDKATDRQTRQPLLLGREEIEYLGSEAANLMKETAGLSKKKGKDGGEDPVTAAIAAWAASAKANLRAMRESCRMPAGIDAAMFGRMVTADPAANLDAALHVAHAFTVHAEEAEPDFFTVVDDLTNPRSETAADHIGETEITCGLFYGYVEIDVATLMENIGDAGTAAEAASRMVRLIARTSPGAKAGATAPYAYASYMLIEFGRRQPRSLAGAFRRPCEASAEAAVEALHRHLGRQDRAYGCGEERRVLIVDTDAPAELPEGTEAVNNLEELAEWTRGRIGAGAAS